MSDPVTLAVLAARLLPFAQNVRHATSRLRAERGAGWAPASSELMDSNLDKTLDRLRGGQIEDSWWRTILKLFGQKYIAPGFLTKPAVQDWLAQGLVGDGLKALAGAIVMGGDGEDAEVREQLAKSYSDRTGEACQLAGGPIDVAVSMLVAGYIASIPADQLPLAGMVQDLSGRMEERFDRLEEARLSASTDSVTRNVHTDQAEQELAKILRLRAFDPIRARRNCEELLTRVCEGDLEAASPPIKTQIRYWTARLCTGDAETLNVAREHRQQLRQTDLEEDLSVVDALLAEGAGQIDQALRLLRDRHDPDSRTALFSLLARSRGATEALAWYAVQATPDDGDFFTAVGWRNWAVNTAKIGKWEEAALRLLGFQSHWHSMPALAFVEGTINAALLLPAEYREMALHSVPIYRGVVPTLSAETAQHHSRASICLEFAQRSLADIADDSLAEFVADWRLWLGLMDPTTKRAKIVRDQISQEMEGGARAVHLMPLAYAFGISFDTEPLRQYLELRKQLGGLNDDELLAECLLAEKRTTPGELVTYLAQHEARLSEVIVPAFLKTIWVEALVQSGRIGEARAMVASHGSKLGDVLSDRLIAMIDEHEGKDLREEWKRLYQKTRSLVDLKNLVAYLKKVEDRAALLPLTRELFDREKTVDHALDVVKSLGDPSAFDHESIIEFLETNAEILEQSDDLKGAKAWALFRAGRLRESNQVNDFLLSHRQNDDDLRLDIGITISSGDWERLATIVDREWSRRESHTPEMLMTLAEVACQDRHIADRALRFGRLATEKASEDPFVLASAYGLYFRLGRDQEADLGWLMRASELSSAADGPLWRMELKDVVTEWLPKQQEYCDEVLRKWLGGELPTSWAASRLNMSMARLLLHVPERNLTELDGRQRTLLPIIAGGRNPVQLQAEWTIGLDVSSIMVLDYLNLLKTAVNAFHHVKLAPDIMDSLFQERDEVRFHQPSRIAAAQQVRELLNRGGIKATQLIARPSASVAAELGGELATLLQMATRERGKVICTLPIYRPASLMGQRADTSDFDDVILSTADICTLLHDAGKIDTATYRRAAVFLKGRGQTEQEELPWSILNGPLYVDRTALSYLQDADILGPMVSASLDVRIHPSVLDEVNDLIETGQAGSDLATRIEGIRNVLRDAVESGAASFLPLTDTGQPDPSYDVRLQATVSLLAGQNSCDALCIDDRFFYHRTVMADGRQRSVTVACVLDVLRHLVAQGNVSTVEHWTARHKLRQSGFAFLPLESDELFHWLKAARFTDGRLTESAEMRVLRQTTAFADSLDVADPGESLALAASVMGTCRQVIFKVWEDTSLTTEQAVALSDWVWRNLSTTSIPSRRHLPADSYADWVKRTMAWRLGAMSLPMAIGTQDRRAGYRRWLERAVFQPLGMANADMIESTLSSVCEFVAASGEDQEIFGNVFLEQLPDAVRTRVIARNADFASRSGFQTRRLFGIGTDFKLPTDELFAAARKGFTIKGERTVGDVAGKQVSMGLDSVTGKIAVRWTDAAAATQQTLIPELSLLSPDRDARLAAFQEVMDHLGPTATDFRYLLKDIESRELNDWELSTVLDEVSNGMTTFQLRLIGRIQRGLGFSVADLVPSVLYFERFTGPSPDERESEAYFREVLVPYRQGLLARNLRAGLDICFLGALRDDLAPGPWVDSVDDDAVWEALSSCDVKGNPFALLAGLDVALYRQGDPRFREFAADAVVWLSDENFGLSDGPDIYRLLPVLVELVFNRINLLEGGAIRPGYWKRMSAWMQAGLAARTLMGVSSSIDIDDLQEWTRKDMGVEGVYSELVDARKEPMFVASRITPRALRSEIVGRLQILRSRHEGQGREVPRSEEIDRVLAPSDKPEKTIVLGFPGPLEGHRRPSEPIPQELDQGIGDALAARSAVSGLAQLATVSQLYALSERILDRARDAVMMIAENAGDTDKQDNLKCLELASHVAASTRDVRLADCIADAVVGMVPTITTEEEIAIVLEITLQAAAAHEPHDAWFKWLEERLKRIAAVLPAPPNGSLNIFLRHLDKMGSILPVGSWFQIGARSMALAGVA